MLILASASPRRRELLTQAGLDFTVVPADIDESLLPNESPAAYVQRLATEKARAVCARFRSQNPGASGFVVLAADTAVVLDAPAGEALVPGASVILGKPADPADAARMLGLLSGRAHVVMTGVAVLDGNPGGRLVSGVEVTRVHVNPITAAEIAAYVATGEPLDKAGAYAIQGFAARWIPRIEGCYFNVVGLPVAKVISMLAQVTTPRSHQSEK